MTKVKINPTPSEELVKQAAAEVDITDAKGRVIRLKKPGVLAQFRLVEALGDAAKNEVYVGMVIPLIYVDSIDGAIVPALAQKSHVEALIARLDEEGVAAVLDGVQKHFGKTSPEADRAALKN